MRRGNCPGRTQRPIQPERIAGGLDKGWEGALCGLFLRFFRGDFDYFREASPPPALLRPLSSPPGKSPPPAVRSTIKIISAVSFTVFRILVFRVTVVRITVVKGVRNGDTRDGIA